MELIYWTLHMLCWHVVDYFVHQQLGKYSQNLYLNTIFWLKNQSCGWHFLFVCSQAWHTVKHFLIYHISAKTVPPSAYTNVSGTLFIKEYFSLFLLQYKQVFVRRQHKCLEVEAAWCCFSRIGFCFCQRKFGKTWEKTFIANFSEWLLDDLFLINN